MWDSISFFVFNSQLTKAFGGVYSGNIGIGAFLVIIAFIAVIIINIAIKKQNAPIKYKDLSECIERLEKRKQELALI